MDSEGDSAKRTATARISPDLPIRKVDEDRLNRRGFASAIAKVISNWRRRPSLVIGLFGEWGSGKSSIKNMVVESLAENIRNPVSVIEFSPWQISGQEMLVQTFFNEMGKAIGKTAGNDADLAKRRAARWKLYSSALSMFATVAKTWQAVAHPTGLSHLVASGTSLALGGASEVVKAGTEGVEAEASLDRLSLAELKEQIASDLESLPQPLLVVLDDIDRLTKEEIRLTLQLVKANADFPNIVYLLVAQREAMRVALEEVAPGRADQFLEKIIQIGFDVPMVNRRQYEALLFEGLNALLEGPGLESRFSSKYWHTVSQHLLPLFNTVRDINRFLAGLAFHVELFRNGETFEVNPVDLIVLEALRFFEPDLYKRIPLEKQVLTLQPRWFRKEDRENDKRRVDDLVSLASEPRKSAIRKILGEIFPPSGLARGANYGDDFENTWFQQLRACSYQAFDRYFELATPEGDVSQAQIDALIGCMSSKVDLDSTFTSLREQDLLDVMLARLHSLVLAGNVPVEDAVNFLASLFDIEAPDRSYGFLDSSPFDRIAGITYWHLQRVDKAKRADLLIEALKNARHFALAIKVLWDFARDPAPESNVAPLLPAAEDRERLRKASLDKIRAAAVEGDDTQVDELFQISGHWANWDEAAAQSWVASHLDTRDAIAKFLKQIQSTADGTGGPKKFIQVGSFERIIPPNILVEKVDSHLTGELTNDEQVSIRMLKAAIKRHEEGKDNNPFAILSE
ncbi:MAG: P-loop NTPase fold protein [Terracidiphilus sp.]